MMNRSGAWGANSPGCNAISRDLETSDSHGYGLQVWLHWDQKVSLCETVEAL
jgi:hypothetical protein